MVFGLACLDAWTEVFRGLRLYVCIAGMRGLSAVVYCGDEVLERGVELSQWYVLLAGRGYFSYARRVFDVKSLMRKSTLFTWLARVIFLLESYLWTGLHCRKVSEK